MLAPPRKLHFERRVLGLSNATDRGAVWACTKKRGASNGNSNDALSLSRSPLMIMIIMSYLTVHSCLREMITIFVRGRGDERAALNLETGQADQDLEPPNSCPSSSSPSRSPSSCRPATGDVNLSRPTGRSLTGQAGSSNNGCNDDAGNEIRAPDRQCSKEEHDDDKTPGAPRDLLGSCESARVQSMATLSLQLQSYQRDAADEIGTV